MKTEPAKPSDFVDKQLAKGLEYIHDQIKAPPAAANAPATKSP